MREAFGIAAGLTHILSSFPYIRDILARKTKPHRGSFLIWLVLDLIALFSQLAKGATWSLTLPGVDAIGVGLIFILSIRYGVGGLNRLDVTGLALAGLGLVLWYFTKQPLTALLIIIAVDGIGLVMTFLKTYDAPYSETLSSWAIVALGGILAAFAVGQLNPPLLLWPIYIFLSCGAMSIVIWQRRTRIVQA